MVQGRKIRHLHSLGRLFGPCLRQRMVSAKHVRAGFDAYKHQIATYGPQDKFGYKDFIPMFKAEHFDPAAWAELFKKAGAKYVVPVAEHHDGFAMYDSGLSDWTVAKMGPHRDTIGELAQGSAIGRVAFWSVIASGRARFLYGCGPHHRF